MSFYSRSLILLLMINTIYAPAIASSNDIEFKGTLVAEPCVVGVGPDGENVVVDFGTIPDKTFYSIYGRRTWLQSFRILLKDCDLSLGKEVKITFTGTEDAEQSGLLAVTSSTGVTHVAIGLQTSSGADLKFNQKTDSYALNKGNNSLDFKAYVQASDEGVRNKSVGRGRFEAVSTFELDYP